jgi:hypothetical protein
LRLHGLEILRKQVFQGLLKSLQFLTGNVPLPIYPLTIRLYGRGGWGFGCIFVTCWQNLRNTPFRSLARLYNKLRSQCHRQHFIDK